MVSCDLVADTKAVRNAFDMLRCQMKETSNKGSSQSITLDGCR